MKVNTMMAKMKAIRDNAIRQSTSFGIEKMGDKEGNRWTEAKMGPLGAIKIPDKKNVVSGVKATMSIPKSKRTMKRANRDADILLQAKKYKDMPLYDNSGMVTDAFKAKSLADEVKERLSKKK